MLLYYSATKLKRNLLINIIYVLILLSVRVGLYSTLDRIEQLSLDTVTAENTGDVESDLLLKASNEKVIKHYNTVKAVLISIDVLGSGLYGLVLNSMNAKEHRLLRMLGAKQSYIICSILISSGIILFICSGLVLLASELIFMLGSIVGITWLPSTAPNIINTSALISSVVFILIQIFPALHIDISAK